MGAPMHLPPSITGSVNSMNHVYKVIFNRTCECSQVASELASGAGKTTACTGKRVVKGVAMAWLLVCIPVMAAEYDLPTSAGTDGAVDSGQSGTAAVAPITTDGDTYNLILGNSLTGGNGAKGLPNASGVAGNGVWASKWMAATIFSTLTAT